MAIFPLFASPGRYKKTGGEKAHRRSKKGVVAGRQIQFPHNRWVEPLEIGRSWINKSLQLYCKSNVQFLIP